MALKDPSSLLKEGFIVFEDEEVGKATSALIQKRFPFQTEEGLEYIRKSVVEDERVRDTVEAIFEHSELGLIKIFSPEQDTAFAFLNNESSTTVTEVHKRKDAVKAICALFLSPNSTMVFYKGSHLFALQAEITDEELLVVPEESLNRAEILSYKITMSNGGLAIIDGSLAFSILSTYTVVLVFAVEEQVQWWSKMSFPNIPGVIRKIKATCSEKIGVHAEFVKKRFRNKINPRRS